MKYKLRQHHVQQTSTSRLSLSEGCKLELGYNEFALIGRNVEAKLRNLLPQALPMCDLKESSIACSQNLVVHAAAVRRALLPRGLLTGTVPTSSCSSSAALLQQEWPAEGEALCEL